MKKLQWVGVFAVCLMASGTAMAGGKVMITTHVKDFVVVNGNIGCPKGGGKSAFAVNYEKLLGKMPEAKMEQLNRLIQQFEAKHGAKVKSRTSTRDFQTESDIVSTESVGPYEGIGAQICNLIRPYI